MTKGASIGIRSSRHRSDRPFPCSEPSSDKNTAAA
jgi:hypothetical protein